MKTFIEPNKTKLVELVERPTQSMEKLFPIISDIFSEIKSGGDNAIRKFTRKFDKVETSNITVAEEEIEEAETNISDEIKQAIKTAKNNIELFHKAQQSKEITVDIGTGIKCWQKPIPIDSVGLYIPGGTAPLFSTVLMLAIPAKIAGCKEIVVASPPEKSTGKIHPAVLYASKICGVHKIYKMGGAQAIAALNYGTESVSKVNKIFGPGNQYVTAAKMYSFMHGTAIDMPAGPSEVLVFADCSANASYIAADLLSQAEHGKDSQVVMVTTDKLMIEEVKKEIKVQLTNLPRKEIAEASLDNSYYIYLETTDAAFDFINLYAPEHFIISSTNAESYINLIRNAGSVFIGNYSPESAGDYATGTNHTLPTAGAATAFSGVNLDSFIKKITYQQLTKEGLTSLAQSITTMAREEQLEAHARAVDIRLK